MIRELQASDHDAVIAIMAALPEWFTPDALTHARVDLRYHRGFVAVDDKDGQIIGFATYFVYDGIGNLSWIGVAPGWRRHGLGTHLLHAVEQAVRNDGIPVLQVFTLSDSVEYAPYNSTRAFYKRNGFKEFRRIPTDNPECLEELFLRKLLA